MRVLGWVHGYLPVLRGGAEIALHEVCKHLVREGHEVVVGSLDPDQAQSGMFDGVTVLADRRLDAASLFGWCDVVITQCGAEADAGERARRVARPVVRYLHNHWDLPARADDARLVAACSRTVAEVVPETWPTLVVQPPVIPELYDVPGSPAERSSVGFVNLIPQKGADLFWALARVEPRRQFLAVRGGWGQQVIPATRPRNVTLLPTTRFLRERLYAKTRVMLVPSAYESWGRVAVEALCAGVPVIAHPNAGLLESLGDAATFVDHGDVAGYQRALADLDNPDLHAEMAARGRARAADLAANGRGQVAELTAALERLADG